MSGAAGDPAAVWQRNARPWTRAVRDGAIASRRAGTDDAIVAAIRARRPRRILDLGCGEGWLVRRLAGEAECVGVDGAPALIAAARQADPEGRYAIATYADIVAGGHDIAPGLDVVALNFALFEEDLAPLLGALPGLLAPGGAAIVQSVHPVALPEHARDADHWRVEDFAAFDGTDWTAMRWFYRTPDSWRATFRAAGLSVAETKESVDADGAPLSLIFVAEKVAGS